MHGTWVFVGKPLAEYKVVKVKRWFLTTNSSLQGDDDDIGEDFDDHDENDDGDDDLAHRRAAFPRFKVHLLVQDLAAKCLRPVWLCSGSTHRKIL